MEDQNEEIKKKKEPVGKEKNLKPFTSEQSREEARKNGRLGGIKSGEVRRQRKTFAEDLKVALSLIEANGNSVQENIVAGMCKKAQSGNAKAFEAIRDTVGEIVKKDISLTTNNIKVNLTED